MTRGKLAKKYNINPETIRYYENVGLISPERDARSGYRHYNEFHNSKLEMILRFKELGFSLNEIKTFFELLEYSTRDPGHFREYINEKVDEIDSKVEALRETKRALIQFRDREDKNTCEMFSKFIEKY